MASASFNPKVSASEQEQLPKFKLPQQQTAVHSVFGLTGVEQEIVPVSCPPQAASAASAAPLPSDSEKLSELIPEAVVAGELSVGLGISAVYLKNCHNCRFTLSQRTSKVLIEGCSNLQLTLSGPILTRTVEMWRCTDSTLNINTEVKTLQLDLLKGQCQLNWQQAQLFYGGSVIWQSVESLSFNFADAPRHNMTTSFDAMKLALPDCDAQIDQFIVRFLGKEESSYVLTSERCIRLKNGFLSTEREAVEWEKRNDAVKEAHLAQFLKDSGIRLNPEHKKKVAMNASCPCSSGKKFKKCCFGVKELTGVAGSIKARC